MKIVEWRNIPSAKFPLSFRYFLRWISKPIKPFLFTQICKINNGNFFVIFFKLFNFVFLKWNIKIQYLGKENQYKISDNRRDIIIKHKTYIPLYSEGISQRLEKLKNEYLFEHFQLDKDDEVIDVGACVGEVAVILNDEYNCRVHCFEPEESEFNCLIKNTNSAFTKSYNIPLWKEKKEISFYSSNESHDLSCFETEDYSNITKKKADTLNNIFFDFIKNEIPIKLLKLEAEGAEPEILEGANLLLPYIKYIVADVGAEKGLKFETTLVNTINYLNKNNFELIEFGSPRLMCLFKNKKI